MADYLQAFKLPFSNWQRAGILLLLVVAAGLPADVAQLFSKRVLSFAVAVGLANFIAISIILVIISAILYLMTTGYSVRLTGYAAHGRNIMAPFEKPFSLLAAGLKYVVAVLLYALPLVLLVALSILLLKDQSQLRIVGLVLLVFSVIVAIAWAFFMFYSGPMLMAHFAYENRFAAFFEVGKILKYSFTVAYFVPWIVAFGYSIGLAMPLVVLILPLALIAQLYPVVNIFSSILSALYVAVLTPTVASLYGQAYRDVVAGGREKAPAEPAEKAKGQRKQKA